MAEETETTPDELLINNTWSLSHLQTTPLLHSSLPGGLPIASSEHQPG